MWFAVTFSRLDLGILLKRSNILGGGNLVSSSYCQIAGRVTVKGGV
jgi:hypothetical protein